MEKAKQVLLRLYHKIGFKRLVLGSLVAVALIVLLIIFWPQISYMVSAEGMERIRRTIHKAGIWGVFIFLGIQILQIIVAVIPGEPIEVLAGVLYGTWGGLALCLLGILLGTALVFFVVKWLGRSFVEKVAKGEALSRFGFLHNAQRLESLVFILFLIPGTPKDVLTYVVPLTAIRPLRFFLIATFSRLPSVISSTWAGATLQSGKWWMTILIFAGTAGIGLLGIWLNNRLMGHLQQREKEKDQNEER